jgi:PAS domain S-box-containing protein
MCLRAKVSVFVELHRKSRELEHLNRELETRVEQRTRQLQESENLLRERADLLELASEAILVRDLAGVLTYWNAGAEALYGWERSEVLGNPVHEILETEFPVEVTSSESTLINRGRWDGNLVQKTRDGREVIVASRQVFKKEVGSILEINRDITAQIRAEEALRQTERLAAMGRVAGIIAHEINNPLEAITNAFYLLRITLPWMKRRATMPNWERRNLQGWAYYQADTGLLPGVSTSCQRADCRDSR